MTRKLIILAILLLVSANSFAQSYSRVNPDSIPFAPAVNYPVGDNPVSIFCADLDKDGYSDLAVANFNGNTISILINKGDGTFKPPMNYGVGNNPLSVFCADLDGDGALDCATANWDGGNVGNVSILKNNGDGTFKNAVYYSAGHSPHYVFCANLDNDSNPDLAVANNYGASVSILKNNGDGTFQNPVDYGLASFPTSVFCADLNGDLNPDLALTVGDWYNGNVFVLKNNGDGTFQNAVSYNVGVNPYSVFCADLNKDSYLDLVVANTWSNSLAILKNNGDGTFQNAIYYSVGIDPVSVFCADLDGDSELDLIVANGGSKNVSILKNNGDGTFKNPVNYATGKGPRSVYCADLDGDGDLDLAVVNADDDSVSILINLTPNPISAFLLLTPTDQDSLNNLIHFNWQASLGHDPRDTIRYDLYLSSSIVFHPDSTIVYDSLLDTTFVDSLGPNNWYWKVKAYDKWGAVRWSDQSWSFYVYRSGDVNADSKVTVSDVVYLINFLFKGGPAPKPYRAGEVNCDGYVTVADVVYLVNYLFKGGPPPNC